MYRELGLIAVFITQVVKDLVFPAEDSVKLAERVGGAYFKIR